MLFFWALLLDLVEWAVIQSSNIDVRQSYFTCALCILQLPIKMIFLQLERNNLKIMNFFLAHFAVNLYFKQ